MRYLFIRLSILIALIFSSCEQDTYEIGDLEGVWTVSQYSMSGNFDTNPYEVLIEKQSGGNILLIRNFLNLAGTYETKQEIFTAHANVYGTNFTLIDRILDQDYTIHYSPNGKILNNGNTIQITFICSFAGRQEEVNATFIRNKIKASNQ